MSGCTHPGRLYAVVGHEIVTCGHCWQRLVIDWTPPITLSAARPAPAPRMCSHGDAARLTPMDSPIDGRLFAVCGACGCVVTRPDGPGRWTDAMFYGHLIREQETSEELLS